VPYSFGRRIEVVDIFVHSFCMVAFDHTVKNQPSVFQLPKSIHDGRKWNSPYLLLPPMTLIARRAQPQPAFANLRSVTLHTFGHEENDDAILHTESPWLLKLLRKRHHLGNVSSRTRLRYLLRNAALRN
jgi:hypothetical protein